MSEIAFDPARPFEVVHSRFYGPERSATFATAAEAFAFLRTVRGVDDWFVRVYLGPEASPFARRFAVLARGQGDPVPIDPCDDEPEPEDTRCAPDCYFCGGQGCPSWSDVPSFR